MDATVFDNKARIVRDDLVALLGEGDRVSVAASVFSMYAYRALSEQLEALEEFRFIFTSDAFTADRPKKEKREFYIPRLSREQGLFGTQLEIKLRNELTQKAVATECADWIRRKARFKSFSGQSGMNSFLEVHKDSDDIVYLPFDAFTTGKLGTERDEAAYAMTTRLDPVSSRQFLRNFDQAWDSGELQDVTESVIDSISAMYAENPPELVYYSALFRIFSEFLDDVSEDVLPNEGVGFRQSAIWGKLFDFQRDAALAIINKLETYNGCILADSVGLGKTFTALAVIKYYESRNRNVLVLCPKKLRDNWLTYNRNVVNNPIASDRLRYDVLYHTDLSRTRGMSETGIPLDTINWGAYDLVVIDESHNFRNGADSARGMEDGKENRYQLLMRKVVSEGVQTKVLMLSATPVNNRFRDLRNQLALAYAGDSSRWEGRLKIDGDVESVFRRAQAAFNRWSKLDPDQRTTDALTAMLDFDFFEVLDQVTVARSRRHIQRHYDMSALGPFPERLKPISKRPHLSTLPGAISYHEIYEELDALTLAIYVPSLYLLPSRADKYAGEGGGNLTMAGRERGMRRLMNTNLLKRLESSVWSFRMTLERVLSYMEETLETIRAFKGDRGPRAVVTDASGQFDPNNDNRTWFYAHYYAGGEGVLTATSTPDATRELVTSGRICAIGKYVGLGFTPWDGVTGPTHRQHLTSATFAADMASFSYLNLNYLFYSCTNLASISGLGNLSGVRSMRYTFSSCAFTTIDFRGFDPSTLTDLFYTFSGCSHLTTIYADATWALPSSGITGSQCFYSCSTSLVGGNGTVWASNKTAYSYLRIDTAGAQGYMTAA